MNQGYENKTKQKKVNDIGDEGAKKVGKLLMINTTLTSLDLDC